MDNYYKNKFHNAMDIVKQLRIKNMETKPWWASKALAGAIIVGVSGVLQVLGYDDYAQILIAVGTALGIAGLRMANTNIK